MGLGAVSLRAPYYGSQTAGVTVWRERYRWQPAEVYFYQPPQTNYYAFVPLAPGEAYIPYTANFRPARDVTVVNYSPRFLREQRAVYMVSPQDLELRAHPRKADRVVLERVARLGNEQVEIAKLPNPNRVVAADRIAKVKPAKDAVARQVVVTQKSLDRPMKPATERALAREQRQVRKADQKPLKVDRQPVTAGNVQPNVQPADRGKGRVTGEAATVQPQPQATDKRAERQARRAERQQQPAVQPDRQARQQQRQLQRQQRQQQPPVAKPQRAQGRQPNVQRQPRVEQRAIRQQQPRVEQQPRAPKAERQAVRQAQPRATKPNGGGGKRNRP